MRSLAPRWGLMDQPAARKVHLVPTPLGGGIGIWLGVVLPLVGALAIAWVIPALPFLTNLLPAQILPHLDGVRYRSGTLWAILAGGTVLSIMGLFDDWKSLPWQPRLIGQFAVACALVFGAGIQATVFVSLPWIGLLLTVVWIMGLINSLNFLDNMDGLSAGIGLISSILFATIMLTATSEPRMLVGGFLLILAGSLLGFLFHNRPPAKIFMGDTGSYFIGLLLACMTVQGTFYEYSRTGTHVILAPLCILAVPLYDTCSVILIRLWQRRSPFQPDKSHFSHRLVELGLSKPAAVATIHLTTLMTGLGGLLLYQVDNWYAAGLIFALILCVLTVIAILETAGRSQKQSQA
jgi:UDP-GlcNAc:undecaprenyl-phosphate GlcNAc-1-phosphate transferase